LRTSHATPIAVAAYRPAGIGAITPARMSESTARPIDYAAAPAPEAGPPKGALAAIFLVAAMDFLGFGIIIPLLPRLIPDYRENALKVTLIFSVYSICQFIGAPVLGALSDRVGRRPVLVISQLGSAVGYLLLGLAPFAAGWWEQAAPADGSLLRTLLPSAAAATLLVVYASRVIDGFTGGNIATAQAYISDVTTSANRAKGMGMLGAAFGVGFSFGPALGGLLGYYGVKMFGPQGVSLPAYVAAALAALAAVLSWTRLTEGRTHKPTEAEVWFHPSKFTGVFRNPVVGQLLGLSFFIMAAFVMMECVLVLFLDTHFGFKELGTGLFFGWLGLCIVVVQGGVVGRLSKKVGEWPLAVAGPILVAVGMAVFTATAFVDEAAGSTTTGVGYAVGLALLLLAGAVNATGRSLQQPATSALLSKYSSPRDQGVVFGVYHGLGSLARVAGPIVAGLAYPWWKGSSLHNTGPFVTAGVIAVLVALWTMTLRRTAGSPQAAAAGPDAAAAEPS
jgi:DHA1 family tetracycline resistance protein-like MFS transporter